MRLTKEQWQARAECYQEAADHLLADWTTDKTERKQARIVYHLLFAKAVKCQTEANNSPTIEPAPVNQSAS